MNTCIRQLAHSDNESELESLCKLIPTIGEKMEREEKAKELMPKMFAVIHQIINSGKSAGKEPAVVSKRVICLLQDVCDLKQVKLKFQITFKIFWIFYLKYDSIIIFKKMKYDSFLWLIYEIRPYFGSSIWNRTLFGNCDLQYDLIVFLKYDTILN